jgi:hypothetical protein
MVSQKPSTDEGIMTQALASTGRQGLHAQNKGRMLPTSMGTSGKKTSQRLCLPQAGIEYRLQPKAQQHEGQSGQQQQADRFENPIAAAAP